MPPMRLAILDDVSENPDTPTKDVRKRLGKPRTTVDRQLQALTQLGVLDVEEHESTYNGKPSTVWRYRVAEGIDPGSLVAKKCPEMFLGPKPQVKEAGPLSTSCSFSGHFETPTESGDIPRVNGICPICGDPSHWANARNGHVHADCEVPA